MNLPTGGDNQGQQMLHIFNAVVSLALGT